MSAVDIISTVLIALGCFLSLVGALGLLRLPDFYARLHAVGVTDTLCSVLILAGLGLQTGLSLATVKVFFIFMLLWFTSPTSSYALASNAWRWGLRNNDPSSEKSLNKGGGE